MTVPRPRIEFTVHGNPEPKGSARAFVPRGWKRPVITSANPHLRKWEDTIRAELQRVMADVSPDVLAELFEAPVRVSLVFMMARPKSLPKRVTEATKKPDLDKLTRGAIDALSGLLFRDDAQVIAIDACKLYAAQGAHLTIRVESYASPLFAHSA